MTSLYQVALRGQVVATITAKKKRVKRWFYIDMIKALDPSIEREDAIVSMPEEKFNASDFGRKIGLDLRTPEDEFRELMYPASMIFAGMIVAKQFIEHSMREGSFRRSGPLYPASRTPQSELHSAPTDLWVLLKSFIRSIRCAASGSSF